MTTTTQQASRPRELAAGEARPPELSVVVLVTGEPEPLEALYDELLAAVRVACRDLEFIFVVEPEFLPMATDLSERAARGEPITIVRVGQTLGHTRLLRAGLRHCRGSIIMTLPGRRRVESSALPRLLDAVHGGADMAVASRGAQRDSWMSGVRSRVYHALVTRVVRTPAVIADVTSGVRAIRREVLDVLPLYGDSATLLPLLAMREGYSVVEIAANRHSGDRPPTFRSPFVYLRSLFDLFSLFFLLRFMEKPLRFFGLVGLVGALPGSFILAVVAVQRFFWGRAAADRPLMLLGLLILVLGIQTIALGLVGEIIVHLHAARRPMYRLKDEVRR